MIGSRPLDAHEAARKIQAGTLSPRAYTESLLENVHTCEEEVRAWEFLNTEAVAATADLVTADLGCLAGIPVGVKDIFDTSDMPTAYGSSIYSGHQPAWDASCVARIRNAGGQVMGKTVTTEFAFFSPGKTRNPHHTAHTPGGSSSGSAAAVAAGMVPLALGTQTAGSMIRPAAFCGIVGYKPTFGFVCRAGLKSFSESLDTVGVFAASVKDAAFLAAVLSGRDGLSPGDAAFTPRIGLCRSYEWDHAEPVMQDAFDKAGTQLAKAGAKVVNFNLSSPFSGLATVQKAIMLFEGAQALAHEHRVHRNHLSDRLRNDLNEGLVISAMSVDQGKMLADKCRRCLADEMDELGLDALLTPSAIGAAPAGLEATGDPVFCRAWTLLGVPCINVPGLHAPSGLPLGVQVVGRFGDDARALMVADWVQSAFGTSSNYRE